MKEFKYNILIDAENICDRQNEVVALIKAAQKNRKIVLLAPRRYGKTSIMKNMVIAELQKKDPQKLIIFVDLMEVESLSSIASRIEHSIAKALVASINPKNLFKACVNAFKNLELQISVDAYTGTPSVVFAKKSINEHKNLGAVLDGICNLAQKQQIIFVCDEFQDIVFIKEAQGIFRTALQQLTNSAVFILGSKRHLMERMINSNNAPLFHFGDEIHLGPIAEEDWLPYFNERLALKKASITADALHFLCERMCDVPNAICEVGAWLQDHYANCALDSADVAKALDDMVELKQSYAYHLQNFSHKERDFLQAVAKDNFVLKPYAMGFLKTVSISKSNVGKLLKKLTDIGIIEYDLDKGWRLSDPMFAHYLRSIIL